MTNFTAIQGTGSAACAREPPGRPHAFQASARLTAQVAAAIVATLETRHLTARASTMAIDPTGIQRICDGELTRFSLDRLIRIAGRVGQRVDLTISLASPAT